MQRQVDPGADLVQRKPVRDQIFYRQNTAENQIGGLLL